MTPTTYTSSSKGTLQIAEMAPEHMTNVVNKLLAETNRTAEQNALLSAFQAELVRRPVIAA